LVSGDPRYLTTEQLRELAGSDLVTVGAHGATHRTRTRSVLVRLARQP
jgi:hypothetical protein